MMSHNEFLSLWSSGLSETTNTGWEIVVCHDHSCPEGTLHKEVILILVVLVTMFRLFPG